MNRLLVLVVLILIPVMILTDSGEEAEVVIANTLEIKSLEMPIFDDKIDESIDNSMQVLVSSKKDKSDAFYVDLDDYVIGVVAGEMPASFNMEALKAQAVAARTYALYKQKNISNYVLSTSVSDQVYLSVDEMRSKWGSEFQYYYDRVKEAVLSTSNQVITYNGDIIIAYYFAISNGYTEDAKSVFNESRDYLVAVDSKWDKNYSSYASSFVISKNSFCTKLGVDCSNLNIGDAKRNEHNYVLSIDINNKTFTGLEVFNKLALKSTDFSFKIEGDNIRVITYGFGHAVGMSQYGAQGMASAGYSYQDILTHYYKNTKISEIQV